MTIITPLVTPRCPFKVPFFKGALKPGWQRLVPLVLRLLDHALCSKSQWSPALEEDDAVREGQEDTDLLLSIDTIVADDSLLNTLWTTLKQSTPTSERCMQFVLYRA